MYTASTFGMRLFVGSVYQNKKVTLMYELCVIFLFFMYNNAVCLIDKNNQSYSNFCRSEYCKRKPLLTILFFR